eukprot:7910788-Alexandrium_andersonii.AAC.1
MAGGVGQEEALDAAGPEASAAGLLRGPDGREGPAAVGPVSGGSHVVLLGVRGAALGPGGQQVQDLLHPQGHDAAGLPRAGEADGA